jgi:hypothetical protein
MTKLDKTKKEQLAVARKVLARYDVAFSILAKGEAERQLQRYRVASSQ